MENKQPKWSYHGYATTDYYKVVPRFGINGEYLELAEKGREKGVKIVMDMIMNHCGSGHWWMDDLPSKDWINNPDNYFGLPIGAPHSVIPVPQKVIQSVLQMAGL